MEDQKIVDLYLERSNSAISESDKSYGKYCRCIAYNILYSHEDSEECVNDTWLNAWNAIPPERPSRLRHFFGCITRNLALNRYDYNHAKKRNQNCCSAIDEFWECIPEEETPIEDELILKDAINGLLESLDKRTRSIFIQRYWYVCSVKEIAKSMNMSQANVSVILYRTRIRFKDYLEKEGIFV